MKNIICYSLLLAIIFMACDNEINQVEFPGDTRINFFNATNYPISYLAIDPEDTTDFESIDTDGFVTYNKNLPLGYTGSGKMTHGTIPYMVLAPGSHQFFFADTAQIFRAHKEVDLGTDTHTNLYITDSLLHYDVLQVEANPVQQQSNTVKAQIINLVPDAQINTKLLQQDTLISNNLPQGLPYKAVSEVFELNSEQALDGDFFFRFFHEDEDGEEEQVATAPAVPDARGRMYTIVLQGYREEQTDVPVNDSTNVRFSAGITATVRVNN